MASAFKKNMCVLIIQKQKINLKLILKYQPGDPKIIKPPVSAFNGCKQRHCLFVCSRVVAGESEASSNDLTSTVPSEAFQPTKCCDPSIFNLQIRPVLPQALDVIHFLPERLSTSGNAAIHTKQVRHRNKRNVEKRTSIIQDP